MLIYHIASASDWTEAQRSGAYTTSTRGVSLAEAGFLHAARPEQVDGVFERYYRDAGEPLVLLTIDTERLSVPWREEPVGTETFPHIHGPLSPAAVTRVLRLAPDDRPVRASSALTKEFVREMLVRTGLAVGAMVLAYAGSRLGAALPTDWGAFTGALAGLALGATLALLVLRWRARSAA